MKKMNVSTTKMGKYTGRWVVVDPKRERIIAVGETLKEIGPLVTRSADDKRLTGTVPFAHKVPRVDEGPYILWINKS